MNWNGSSLLPTKIDGSILEVYSEYQVIEGLNYNALDVKAEDIDGDVNIIIAGESDTSVSLQKLVASENIFGWEATPYGFLIAYKFDGKEWRPTILDSFSVLGMDVGKIS